MNILFILADDMGHWALGCAGNPEIRTPHLDRLAGSGIRLANAFCVSPVCSPARASLLTGRIPSQHGVHDWIRRGNAPGESADGAVIEYLAGQPTYTEILARHGYRCGLSGKWHLGAASRPQCGFTFWKPHARGGGPYYNAPFMQDGEEYREPRYVTEAITGHALEFLEAQGGSTQPFHLSVHYTAPHSPWNREHHPSELFDSYCDHCSFASVPDLPMHPWQIDSAPYGTTKAVRRELLSGYFAAVTAMDAGIGQLLDALDARGLTDETLVVFTSDNGMNMGHHGIYGKGNGTYPQNMYDTSVKVPFLAAWPGVIPAGITAHSLFSHYDVAPTVLGCAGLSAEIAPGLPGRDRRSLWSGVEDPNEAVVVFDEYGPVRMIRDGGRKYVHRFPGGPHEYYNLQEDPGESFNAIDEPRWQGEIREMRSRMEEWFLRYVDPLRDGGTTAVTGKGQLDLAEGRDVYAQDWFYLRDKSAGISE